MRKLKKGSIENGCKRALICITILSLCLCTNYQTALAKGRDEYLLDAKVANLKEEFNASYQIYNLETGEVETHLFSELHDYSKDENRLSIEEANMVGGELSLKQPGDVGVNAIIGNDDRTKVDVTSVGPYCNTVYIKAEFSSGSYKEASGFVIANAAVATAAHVVTDSNGNLATKVTIIPGKKGSTYPYGSTEGKKITITSNYLTTKAQKDDWAVVETSAQIGASTGWLGLKTQTSSYNNTYVLNTGYPSPSTCEGQTSDRCMFVGTGRIKSSTSTILKADFDASSGNSGGPVFAYYADTGYTAIGILTAGSSTSTDGSSYPTAYSSITRITNNMYNLFLSYR